jgi:aminopeptidase YwaD
MQNSDYNKEIEHLSSVIETYLKKLCVDITDRSVGSEGNREATAFFASTIKSFGFEVACPPFDCIDWTYGKVRLQAGTEKFEAFAGPYSLSCELKAPLMAASTLDELEQLEVAEKIVLLYGEIASEQLMPKNFTFYNPENHQKIIATLERKKPAAIIAATGRNPQAVGALYPFPLFEDGDFDVPSVYLKDIEGERLLHFLNEEIILKFHSKRIPASGSNVIARKGNSTDSRIVFCAHIDARKGTPGALDNGGGTATLLALAELLKEYQGSQQIEIIAFNGEDYYAAPGQKQYLAQNSAVLNQIALAVNLDDLGYIDGRAGFSFYECPENMMKRLRKILANHPGVFEGEQWHQGDHMIFVLNQRPALAFISEKFEFLMKEIVHTEKDTINLVDCRKLAGIACALRDIFIEL